MKIDIAYEQNPHQVEYQKDDLSKFLHLSSGFGGGKTHGLVMKLLRLSFLNRPHRGGLVAPTIADYKKDVLPIFEDILEKNRIRYRYHKTDKFFIFPWSKGELQVVSAEKKIRGPNWAYAGINEVSLISHNSYKETIGRVRVKGAVHPQIASCGTPEGNDHWLYEVFIEKPMKGSRIIFGDTRDNQANLSDDYIETLLASYDTTMIDAYLRGLFVNMHHNRFYYSYEPHKNLNKTVERIPGEEVCVSLDYNVDPMCAAMWHILPVTEPSGRAKRDVHGQILKEAICFDQIKIAGPKGADTHQMAQALIARGYTPASTTIYPDPSGQSRSTKGQPDNEILKSYGFYKIKTRAKAPPMRERQLAVNNLLDKGLLVINPEKAPDVKRDLEAVQQDKATLEKIKTNPVLTHFSDGMDYFLDIEFPLSGKKPDSRMQRIR